MDSAVLPTALLAVFQSYLDNGRIITKESATVSAVYVASGEIRTSHPEVASAQLGVQEQRAVN